MATVPKYAALPDLDAAPDIYETPELTDDASTAVESSVLRPDSRASSTAGLDGEDSAIDRHRVDPNEARTTFLTNDTREKKSHGWIGSRRAAYRSSSKRLSTAQDEGGLSDISTDDEVESLGRKIARLRQEVAEVKETFRKRRAQARLQDVAMEDQEAEPVSTLDSLGRVLEDIESPQVLDQGNPSRHLLEELDGAYQPGDSQGIVTLAKEPKDGDHSRDGTRITPDYEAYALSKVSDFDKRLRLLETAVGMDVVPLPTQDRGPSRAVLPVLDSLDQQVSTISMTEPSLDKISRQIRQMTHESEKLAEARKAAAAQQSSHHSSSERNRLSANRPGGRSTEDKEDLDQTSKINALYGTLSTIESLSPLLPSVLDRLQSLRAIHADAALASEALSKVESRQAAMSDELEEWKKGLERVESAMQAGERSMKENVAVVDGWVSELEKRLQATKLVDST